VLMKIRYLVSALAILLLWSFKARTPASMEKPVVQLRSSQPSAVARIKSPPANAAGVEIALHRVFGNAVVSDLREGRFVTGDFNGDGSPDLAVLVRPLKADLGFINDPLANWTIQDATQAFLPPTNQTVVLLPKKSARQTVSAGEPLLAIIHGYGELGWRDGQARQAYLVRRAANSTLPMRAIPAPGHVEGAPASIARSDVISVQLDRPGFLFWTGSQYAWRAAPAGDTILASAVAQD